MEPNANPAPAADVTPAPAAPVAPAAPTPEAPAAPVVMPPSPVAPTPPSPEDAAAKAEDDDWDAALKERYPDHKPGDKQELDKDGKPKPEKGGEAKKEGKENPAEKKLDEGAGDGNDAQIKSEGEPAKDADTIAREARATARQSAENFKTTVSEVRAKMFADMQTELRDADGDPIKSIDDVMKLINPNSRTAEAPQGRTFTEEEAGMWLIANQQELNKQIAANEKQIEEIAEVQVTLHDETAYINAKYGPFLKANIELRDGLWEDFEKTLVIDEKSKVITKMPVSLTRFYERALKPYVEAAAKTAETPAVPAPAPAAPVDAAKVAADAARVKQQQRADRADIYVPPTDADAGLSQDDKEWNEAINLEFGDRMPKK